MKTRKLTPKEIALFKKNFECLKFQNDVDIVYESQVPTAGFILLQGQINLLKKNKIQGSIPPHTLIGVHQLIHNAPMKNGLRICSDSEVIVLHKSEIMQELDKKYSEISALIKEIVE